MEVKTSIEERKHLFSGFRWSDLFKPRRINLWNDLPKDVLFEVMLRVSPYEQFCIRATCKNWWVIRPWHNLPKDVLLKVKSRVSYREQFCMRATCKNWWDALTIFPPWHDLPKDILVEVMLRVSPYEQFCVRAACQSWWSMLTDHKLYTPSNKIPGMMTLYTRRNSKPQFVLHHPTHMEAHRITVIKGCSLEKRDILAIKHGWVLCTNFYHRTKNIFLLSPFTKRKIMLPYLNSSYNNMIVATVSPDRIFLADLHNSGLKIRMCGRHDTEWTTCITKVKKFSENLVGVVCIRPFIYIVTICGSVLKYDVHGRHKFLTRSPMDPSKSWGCDFHVLEHNGELILVLLDTHSWREDETSVFRYIWSENVWVPQARIGERAIFIGVTSFLVSEPGDLKNTSERIYYIDGGGYSKFFCLKDRKSYYCEEQEDFEYRGWLAHNGTSRWFIEQP